MNKDAEVALGIKNFRREYTGSVMSLSKVQPIDPITESLEAPNTFNSRFAQLGEALRHCFNAVGDIAVRDKRYIETFLTGYTNPVITQSFRYENSKTYTDNNIYEPNGTPITFPETRVMYSLSRTGQLNFTSVYSWVFKNGVLLDPSKYTIINTSYGVKCFIKATEIADGDEVTVAINRYFNLSDKNGVKYNIVNPVNNVSYVIPVTEFGVFYHTRYLRVMVKRAGRFFTVPEFNILRDMDLTGNTVLVEIHNYPLLSGDEIHINNAINKWEKNITFNRHSTNNLRLPDIELKESKLILGSPTEVPVAYMLSTDFDIFANGYKLTPEIHFSIVENAPTSTKGFSVIRFLFEMLPISNSDDKVEIKIFKNESSGYWDGRNFAYRQNLDASGLLLRKWSSSKLPFMARIGHTHSNGRYQPNESVAVKSHNIIQFNPEIGLLKDFTFQSRTIYTYDIEEVVDFNKNNLNEFDIVTEILGETEMFNRLKEKVIVSAMVNPQNSSTEDNCRIKLYTNRANTHSMNFKTLLDKRNRTGVGVVLDTNRMVIANQELALFHSTGLYLDANAECSQPLIINTNLAV